MSWYQFLDEVDEEEIHINEILSNKTKTKVHDMFRARKTECFFNILIEKHLYLDCN